MLKDGSITFRSECTDMFDFISDMGELNSSLRQLNWLIAKGGEAINESSPPKPAAKSSPRVRSDDKPPYSYTQLIRMAIENSPGQRCSLNGIYTYLADKFEYFRENRNPSWKINLKYKGSIQDKTPNINQKG
ncbi:fork head domain protein [Necator americanus]|uniref:Fork head domain protein n=1 Tax=Necator americanus TaxID=51031 RepID=W2SYI1_NECAM|nr:fork head domain protein [Necator americanus]ETN73961.1 fork head domain protein [Necator americanus]